jgi:glycosyltransferase involved in cell wall biosynthesis
MRILFRHLDPGQGGAVSSMMKMLEGYCRRFPEDVITVMCTAGSPLRNLGKLPNCDVALVGQSVPREAHLLGLADIVVRRIHRRRQFDIFWPVNMGLYFPGGPTQVITLNNTHQVCPVDPAVPHPGSPLRVWMLRALFRRSLRLSAAVIVQTDLMRSLVQAIPGCPELVAVVPKAVAGAGPNTHADPSPRIASRLARAADSAKLVYVATAVPHKNHKILAPVMCEFRRRGLSVTLVLTISAQQWTQFAGPEAASLVESGHVIPLGWVDKDELQGLYQACDASVMPSLAESLSSTHIEAMYWQCPQLTSDLPFAHDICHDAALYAPPGNPAAWCGQIERLLGDSGLRRQLVLRGVERVKDFPASWTEMAEAIRSVFETAIAHRHAEAQIPCTASGRAPGI